MIGFYSEERNDPACEVPDRGRGTARRQIHFPSLCHAGGARRRHQRVAALLRGGGLPQHAPLHERARSEEHTSELQSLAYLVCRLLLEKKKQETTGRTTVPPLR